MPTSIDEKKLQAGDEAPDFTLTDQNGRALHLADLRGKPVVVYFYPKDFTPGCTREACGFRDHHGRMAELEAEVLGISPDTVARHKKFEEEHKLPFQLLADEDHNVMEQYGAWGRKKNYGREYEGVIRSTFLVGADGKIVKVWRNVKVDGHVEKVLEEVGKIV